MSDSDKAAYGNTNFRDKLDMGQIVFRLVDRVNLAASRTYETGVLQKINNLPMSWRIWVENQKDRYTEEKETYTFEAPCGYEIGEIDDPILKDPNTPVLRLYGEIDYEDPNIKEIINNGTEEEPIYEIVLYDPSIPVKRFLGPIDWNDPNIWSPKMSIEEYVNYEMLDAVIMEANEFAGFTYQTELKLVDGGDTLEQIEKRKKTPFRKLRVKEDPIDDKEETN